MIQGFERLRVPDLNKRNTFLADVNWTKNPKINNCQVVRFTFPDGNMAYVKREHLHAILFAIGNPEQQRALIPQTIHKVREIEGWFRVKAKKNIHKGEEVVFPYKIAVPEPEEMVIQDVVKKMQKKGLVKSVYPHLD